MEVYKLVRCLLYKLGYLSLGPTRKEGAATHSCNLRSEDSETGGIPGACFSASLDELVDFRISKRPCLKKQGEALHSPFFPQNPVSRSPPQLFSTAPAGVSPSSLAPSPADLLLYISSPSLPFVSVTRSLGIPWEPADHAGQGSR